MMKDYFDKKAITWDEDPIKLQRSQAVADAIIRQIGNSTAWDAFELGAGTGTLALLLHPHCKRMWLNDTSEGMLDVLREKIKYLNINHTTLSNDELTENTLPPRQFNLVYTNMTLHHVINWEEMLKLFHKMIEPEGFLCIADLDKEDGSFHGIDNLHVHHGFDREKLKEALQTAGFSDIVVETIFEMERTEANNKTKKYPVFLMIAKREKQKERPKFEESKSSQAGES